MDEELWKKKRNLHIETHVLRRENININTRARLLTASIRRAIKEAIKVCRRESSRVNTKASTRNRSVATRKSTICKCRFPGYKARKVNPKDSKDRIKANRRGSKDRIKANRKDSKDKAKASLKANRAKHKANRKDSKVNPRDRYNVHHKEVKYTTTGSAIFQP
uniref:Uncharacterized protein n=1 Tax=Anopheles stephensi TaxID=30069 RepID=A0A182YMI4_ANOST